LEKFRKYTESWLRPGADEPEAVFRVWEGQDGPPSHSVPPHLVAKAARKLGTEPFDRIHERLLTAYFTDNLDITDDEVLRDIWRQADLPAADFGGRDDPNLREAVFQEHNQAIENGATGAPALQIEGGFGTIMGAQPVESYRLWFQRMLDRQA
jgi:predicted DsbA family dithiol-disulfide isomerase